MDKEKTKKKYPKDAEEKKRGGLKKIILFGLWLTLGNAITHMFST
jgi:hypothetical protein